MRTGIYIRVSTEDQANEGYSIDAQKHKLTQFANINDWDIANFYIDEGISAKNTDRPELKRMLDDIKSKQIDVVLVYKLDRLTRSVSDLFTLLDYFDKHNCKFKSATEIFDTTSAIGRLFITIVGAMAQWERENLGERVKMGMEQKAREGKVSKKPVFGYGSHSESEIVKLIFHKYVNENKGMELIAKELNISHPIKKWLQTSISYILKNEMYIGNLTFNKRQRGKIKTDMIRLENIYEPIVSKELFNKAQKIISQRSQLPPQSATRDYVFSTLVKCNICGNKLSGLYSKHGDKKYNRYKCKNSEINLCTLNSLTEAKLLDMVVNYMKQYIKAHINKTKATTVQTTNKAKAVDVEKLRSRKAKLQIMFADDLISKEDYIIRIQEIDNELNSVKPQEPSKTFETNKLLEILQANLKNIKELNKLNQKLFFHTFIEEILLDNNKIVNIKLRTTM